jgi:hypothetical protein
MHNPKMNAVLIRFDRTLTSFERELIEVAALDSADKEAAEDILRRAGALKTAVRKAAGEIKNTHA